MKPDFDAALQEHFKSIANRDIEAFKAHLTKGDTLYTIVQNGHAFTTHPRPLRSMSNGSKTPTGCGMVQSFTRSWEQMWPWRSSNTNTAPSRKTRQS